MFTRLLQQETEEEEAMADSEYDSDDSESDLDDSTGSYRSKGRGRR